ncbi:UbiH/UbiF/VisC/COQ6 family ubiquinone biosynthesis hydroxylase [Telmatospirillum sp.]|uniref:UbiH/UbiF/VisC/COQ6 family ubiquinone biosynthesis hydroxylase n=1 Tax=Telmatospirillum sp. TaxID=2079197 RepID=UPI00283B3B82|nr:UbiH/UbiF/VisC/COQ6 family ubiquinone biosynthesis hydroxylase [Telmatospirillum sp.]MDR3440663.1 UbiH/UbiF/VisC/COQ6 family ubiquinone biosynthesis hydroxylase [Telmatospirillum sp.]
MKDLRTDVLIVGGGLIGGPLAVALASAGLSVAVVDTENPQVAVGQAFDGRASAIALAPQKALAALELWPEIAPRAAAIAQIRVADGHSPLFLHYDHQDIGTDPFGWIVENRAIRAAIARRMADLPAISLFAPSAIAGLDRTAGEVVARLKDGMVLRASLVIAADGRGSPTRGAAGIGLTKWSYGQTAIVCTVAHTRPHNNIAQEHFLPSGPFAILPLPGHRSSVVWSEKAHLAPAIIAQNDADFLAELGSRFGDFLGTIAVEGPRFSYPLALQFANSYTAHRLVLVGDAAHGMHPVAGQGMNMGLRDVAALAEVLVDAKRLGLDIGEASVLERYARWRRFDNLLMLGLTDGLVRLFSNNVMPVQLARDIGLAAVNRIGPMKKFFMRHAMGLVGDLPRLLKGQAL